MSTTLLEFQFRVGGSLTAATSVVLSDPTATYGVRRTGTGGTVVAANTAMTSAATGIYRYTVTDPVPGLTYQWVAKVVYNSATYYFTFTSAGSAGENVAGAYIDREDVEALFGQTNVTDWSNTEGGNPPQADTNAIEDAILDAEADVEGAFVNSIYTVPFVATGADFPKKLKHWCTVLAGWHLYIKKGLHDDGNAPGGKLQALKDEVEKDMLRYAAGYPRQLPGVRLNSAVGIAAQAYNPELGTLDDGQTLTQTNRPAPYRVRRIIGYGYTVV